MHSRDIANNFNCSTVVYLREKTIIRNVDETSTINKVILGLVHPQSDHSKGGSVWARQEV